MKPRKRVTIITPVYNEEECLPRYAEEVTRVLLANTDYEFSILLIDDGSKDKSWKLIQKICAANPAFTGLRLSRNFGAHVALSAGFDVAEGDAVTTLACDLQDPPETILRFLERWEQGAKIVWGRRNSRKDKPWRVFSSNLFYFMVQRFVLPRDSKFTTGSFLLVDRAVVRCLRRLREHNRITFALVAWTGFDQATVDYDRAQRIAGHSGWTITWMLKSTYDTFLGFSTAPIKLITRLGLGICALSMLMLCYLLLSWVIGNPLEGWTSIMAALTGFSGLQFLVIGVIGEYLQRIYIEALNRPLYLVSESTEPDVQL
jgi:dolichol-phosphate mannosyltransferase